MKLCRSLLVFSVVVVMACDQDLNDPNKFTIFNKAFDFNLSDHGWQHGFADLPSNQDTSIYELNYAYTEEPAENRKALMLSGHNRSDDLFMFIKKKLTDLAPNTDYIVTFEVSLASNAMENMVGAGGAPGESVYLKVGATSTEPRRVIEDSTFVMNIDKGNQSQSGEDMIVIGNIATPSYSSGYTIITRSNAAYNAPLRARSNSKGELWLIVGTDSGYEGRTTIYYTKIDAVFSRTGN